MLTRVQKFLSFSFFSLVLFSCSSDEPEKPLTVDFTSPAYNKTLNSITGAITILKSRGTIEEAGFLFGETAGLSLEASSRLNATAANYRYTLEVKDLVANKHYYLKPYAIVEGKGFVGDEVDLKTDQPTYSSVSPLTVGRGQRVKIAGNFITTNVTDVSLKIGNSTAVMLSYSTTQIEILVPESAAIGNAQIVSLKIAGYDLGITETIDISRWSKLTDAPFNTGLSTDITYSYAFNNLLYYFGGNKVYNPATESWTTESSINSLPMMNNLIDFQIGNKGYAGIPDDNTKKFYEFDPVQKKWTQLNDFPGTGHNFYFGLWTSNGTKGYYGLGYNPTAHNEFWEYNPNGDQWTRMPDFPGTSIRAGRSFAINEYIFVGPGYSGTTFKPEVYAFHTVNKNWTQVASFPGTSSGSARTVVIGSKAYLFVKNKIWVYDFDSNSWSLSPDEIPGNPNRVNYDVLVDGDKIYIASGLFDNGGSATYTKEFYKWYPQN